jgi:tRNA dimethylallyltransferase
VLDRNADVIVILGATASGKTRYAVRLAKEIDAEIISMDSRQVYRELNLGVGKDLEEYEGIPYHLIDIISLHEQYHIHQFKEDFFKAYHDITSRGKRVIACGGTGLYFDVLLNKRYFTQVPVNTTLRDELLTKSKGELIGILSKENTIHHTFDTSTHKRLIRAIEIIRYLKENTLVEDNYPSLQWELIGIQRDKESRIDLINKRLAKRVEAGLFEEVESLLTQGFSVERLVYLGLEYKFITDYFEGKYTKEDCIQKLSTAIHQFSKRQLTFFRKLEKDGHHIQWINYEL